MLNTKVKIIILGTIMFSILLNSKFPYLHIQKEKVKTVEINKDNNYIYQNVKLDKVSDKNYVDIQKSIISSLGEVKTQEKELKIEPEWIDIIATAYTSDPKENGGYKGLTASGKALSRGQCATPPDIKFGTKILIDGYGEVVAEDRGHKNYIKWIDEKTVRIDIFMESKSEALKFGVKKFKGYIVK